MLVRHENSGPNMVDQCHEALYKTTQGTESNSWRYHRFNLMIRPVSMEKDYIRNKMWLEIRPNLEFKYIDLGDVPIPDDSFETNSVHGIRMGSKCLLFHHETTYVLRYPSNKSSLQLELEASFQFQPESVATPISNSTFVTVPRITISTKFSPSDMVTLLKLYTYHDSEHTVKLTDTVRYPRQSMKPLKAWNFMGSFANQEYTYLSVYFDRGHHGLTGLIRFCTGGGIKSFSMVNLFNNIDFNKDPPKRRADSVGVEFSDPEFRAHRRDPLRYKQVVINMIREPKGDSIAIIYDMQGLDRVLDKLHKNCSTGSAETRSLEKLLLEKGQACESVGTSYRGQCSVKKAVKATGWIPNKDISDTVVKQELVGNDQYQQMISVTVYWPRLTVFIFALGSREVQICTFGFHGLFFTCSSGSLKRKPDQPRITFYPNSGRVLVKSKDDSDAIFSTKVVQCSHFRNVNCYTCEILGGPFGCVFVRGQCLNRTAKEMTLDKIRDRYKCVQIAEFWPKYYNSSENLTVFIRLTEANPKGFRVSAIRLEGKPCDSINQTGNQLACYMEKLTKGEKGLTVEIEPSPIQKPFVTLTLGTSVPLVIDLPVDVISLLADSKLWPLFLILIIVSVVLITLGVILVQRLSRQASGSNSKSNPLSKSTPTGTHLFYQAPTASENQIAPSESPENLKPRSSEEGLGGSRKKSKSLENGTSGSSMILKSKSTA